MPAHHTPDGFKSPYADESKRGFFKYMKMRLFGGEEFADYAEDAHKIPVTEPDLDRIHRPDPDVPQLTWIGHATALVQYRGVNILTDPVFSDRASPVPFGGAERFTPPGLRMDQLPPVDLVLISHNHYDHLDKDSVEQIGSDPVWLVPLKLKSWFTDQGIDGEKVFEFDWWDEGTFGKTDVTAVPMQHWSARGLRDRNKTLWASYVVRIDDFTFWFCGDTGYNDVQFKEIGRRVGGFDLALIPIGAYEPRWFMKSAHVNPEEALLIHGEVKSRYSVGIHWGAFQLTAEPIDEPPRRLAVAREPLQVPASEFGVMRIGETIAVPLEKPSS